MAIDLDYFDVERYLDEKGIFYRRGGKNVTTGWIETNCPFCKMDGDPDPSEHLGISPSKLYNCWRGGHKGNVLKLIMALEECDFGEAYAIFQMYQTYRLLEEPKKVSKKKAAQVEMPDGASKRFSDGAIRYLESRGFDPDRLIETYDLYCCQNKGIVLIGGKPLNKFRFRIIIPVLESGILVNYVGMDYTRNSNQRYNNCPNELSLIPTKECVYDLDRARKHRKIIVVEGITDKWRIGKTACATLGETFTWEQTVKIAKSGAEKAYIMFDGEVNAIQNAHRLAHRLGEFMKTEVVELADGDPGSFSAREVKEFLAEVGI